MLVFSHIESARNQFSLDCGQLRRGDYDIRIGSEYRLNVAVNRKSAHQAPWAMLLQHADQQREITAASVHYGLKDFRDRHVFLAQSVRLRVLVRTQTDSLRY